MESSSKTLAAIALLLGLTITTACTGSPDATQEKAAVQAKVEGRKAFIPSNDVEFKNYNRSQELYDNPAAIQWCTAFPSSASAPIITVAIAGKLTTSGTSYFSPTEKDSNGTYALGVPARSVDGMFHGDSFYRYGFTPAGQYMDFSNSMQLLCSTALTEYQRQNTFVEGVAKEATVDQVNALQSEAEAALKAGHGEDATNILKGN